MQKFKTESIERLFKVILELGSVDECYEFFEDVCTVKELQDLAQRLDIAVMLEEGKNFIQISSEVGASSATISRVNKCLMYGNGGYKKAIEIIKNKKENGKETGKK